MVTKEHLARRIAEYEDAVLRHMFSKLVAKDADKSCTAKRLFDDLAKFRVAENVEDAVHAEVMQKLDINEAEAIRAGHSVRDMANVVAVAAMPHIHKQ